MQSTRSTWNLALASFFALTMALTSSLWAIPVYAQNTPDDLTADEITGLQFMREEEKLARDVYLTLDETWNLRIFQNISRAEQTHMDAVATLLDRYDISDPVGGNMIGVFTDPDLQALYDQLVAQGNQSLTDALLVGAAIEEIDILDLKERLAQTDDADIVRLYENLLRGSSNHLRAFVTNLERQTGETYEPVYMDQDDYETLMTDSANGNGRGQGGKRSGRGRWGNGRN